MCGSRVIDYFVVSANLSHAVKGVHTFDDTECNPHSAVRLLLRSRLRNDKFRQIKQAPKFNAVLPNGLQNKAHYREVASEVNAQTTQPRVAMAA